MRKRLKYYLIALITVLLLTGVLAIFFAVSQASAGKRRARFDAEHAEPARRAEALLRESVAGSARPEGKGPATQATAEKPMRKKIDILREVSSLCAGAEQDKERINIEIENNMQVRLFGTGKAEDPPEAHGLADLKVIQDMCRSRFIWTNESKLLAPQARKPWDAAMQASTRVIMGGTLNQQLDRLEFLLLDCDWAVPEYQDYQRFSVTIYYIAELDRLAILRALALGESDRAERLFVKGIELFRILCYLRFPEYSNDFNALLETIALLAELPQFPTHGFEEARRILDAGILTPRQRADLRKAYARRWLNATINGPNPVWRQNENWLHWIRVQEKGPETLLLKLMRPRLDQGAIDYASAWEAGDSAAMSRALESMLTCGRLANLYPDAMTAYLENIELKNDLFICADADLIRLWLGMALYRRATGALPDSRQALVPRYLSSTPEEKTEGSWFLGRLEPWENNVNMGTNGQSISVTCQEPARAFAYRIRAYRVLKRESSSDDLLFPCDPRWDVKVDRYLRSGYRQTGAAKQADLVICPVHVKLWEPLLELFRNAARERRVMKTGLKNQSR